MKSFGDISRSQEDLSLNVIDEITEDINMPEFNDRTAKDEATWQ